MRAQATQKEEECLDEDMLKGAKPRSETGDGGHNTREALGRTVIALATSSSIIDYGATNSEHPDPLYPTLMWYMANAVALLGSSHAVSSSASSSCSPCSSVIALEVSSSSTTMAPPVNTRPPIPHADVIHGQRSRLVRELARCVKLSVLIMLPL
eukprot:gene22442-29556_t